MGDGRFMHADANRRQAEFQRVIMDATYGPQRRLGPPLWAYLIHPDVLLLVIFGLAFAVLFAALGCE